MSAPGELGRPARSGDARKEDAMKKFNQWLLKSQRNYYASVLLFSFLVIFLIEHFKLFR
jgi:hypothetical protein